MSKVLIIGGEGYIGSALSSFLSKNNHTVIATQRRNKHAVNYFDLSAPFSNNDLLSNHYDVVIILAAMTNIVKCRKNPEEAKKINVTNTLAILRYFSKRQIYTIFFSTNHVFSCESPHIHWQTKRQPCSYYGELKAMVEQIIEDEQLNCGVIRPSKVIGVNFPLFKNWYKKLKNNEAIECFDDHFIAPMSLSTTCLVVERLMAACDRTWLQLSGVQDVSYFQLAIFFAQACQLPIDSIQPISAESKNVMPLSYGSLAPFFGSNIALSTSINNLDEINAISPLTVIQEFQRGLCV